ncbi:conserved exported hypothetical protein [Rubrivivax sp. A210]|uniref:hypothetical protein n=1 Tax=Rubrivivax sp. A210 TaxID=2772301 RepID=UPI0019183AA0|nr:hypothetical protein [Rubrivivax sp. A210]CAD5373464.1 conserved exported hypothetical protein [Rubrivivax sp. A210]
MKVRAAAWAAAALLALSARAADGAAPVSWTLALSSQWHADALTLARLGDEDAGLLQPRRGRNLAYIDDEARLSRRQGDWTWSLLARSHATLVATDQALELAGLLARGERASADQHWQADVRLRALAGAGIALAHDGALGGGWRWQGEAQLLRLSQWRERRIQGTVDFAAAASQYSFDLRSDELGNRLDFPFREPFAPAGAALLLAAGLAWEGTGAWAEAGLRDGGWLSWRGVPQQAQVLNTDTRAVDGDGFIVYRPLLQGQDSQQGRRERWPWRGRLAGGARLADGQRLGLALDAVPGFGVLSALQWHRPAAGAVPALGLQWRLHERRLTLSAAWGGLTLSAGADRLGAGMRSRELALGYRLAF